MYLFYSKIITGDFHFLSPDESKHCIRVLRLGTGDTVHLTDGMGNLYETIIIEESVKNCKLEIKQLFPEYGKRNFDLHIAIAPTKNLNRFEWFLEKSTEVGIDTITPIICDHSERRFVQSERQNKIITAAMKQSLKAYHPIMNEATGFQKFINQESVSEKFIAYCSDDYKNELKNEYRAGNDALILIGPEGDFSLKEVEQAIKMGYKPVSLGRARLRTETAALVACITFNILNQ